MEFFTSFLLVVIIVLYILAFYYCIIKSGDKDIKMKRFHRAIISIYGRDLSVKESLEQLVVNYNKIFQSSNKSTASNMLDLFESIINCYDTYTEKQFKNKFKTVKNEEVEKFIIVLHKEIINSDPFISLPSKEASFLKTIKEAIEKNNHDLANNSLDQLSKELIAKEKSFMKKEKENQVTTMISIIGVILTVLFGILSFID